MWEDRYDISPEGCWLWNLSLSSDGYASVSAPESSRAHRVMYIRLVGEIPAGLELDHLCGVRRCVNPEHLEPVTHLENHRRSRLGILTESAVIEIRQCDLSDAELATKFGVSRITIEQARLGVSWKAVDVAPRKLERKTPAKTHCLRDHEYTPENTRIEKNGGRKCRQCCAERERARRAAARAERGAE